MSKQMLKIAPTLFDDVEYMPLFAGLPVPVQEQPAAERRDPSGPVASWEWAGKLEDVPTDPRTLAANAARDAVWCRQQTNAATLSRKYGPCWYNHTTVLREQANAMRAAWHATQEATR